jgi:thiol-disulfide isomerase/thioredoxin|tara:strand:- start:2238 stop:3164 length:927 start_codon:yes stop_codon:yes gene_type:complete
MVESLPSKFFSAGNLYKVVLFPMCLALFALLIGCSTEAESDVNVIAEPEITKLQVTSDSKLVDGTRDSSTTIAVIVGSDEPPPTGAEPPRQSPVAASNNVSKSLESPNDKKLSSGFSIGVDETLEDTVIKPYEEEGFYREVKVQIKGKYLPKLAQGYEDAALGWAAPEVKAVGLDGEEIYIGGEGPTTLIMVLAHWCPHCRNEVRELAPFLNDSNSLDRVRMVTLLTSINEDRPNFPPHTWLDLEKWPVPSIVDTPSSQIATAYGVSSFPFFIVVNDRGEIALRMPGRLGVETLGRLLDAIGDMGEEN